MEKILFVFWIGVSLVIALFLFLLGGLSSMSDYQSVEIPKGGGFRDIAYLLSEKKIIQSPKAFMIYGFLSGSAHQLKPGNYSLSAGSSTPAIILSLTAGPKIDQEITFPEGATIKDMDEMLARAKILPKGSLVKASKNLEGFLFPDTYRFFLGSSPEQVIKKFLDNFNKKAMPLLINNKQLTTNNILTIASLLEKEAPEFRDRQIIAGIIYKRLEAGIALHIDSTITYAKCTGAFLTCPDPKVYRKDLTFQSPYNTYIYNGLPPGPIGNPGLEAIKAALNPVKSEYLYYLSEPKTKKTIFSKTLEEHIENRAVYLTK